MNEILDKDFFLIFMIGTFLASVMLFEGLYLLWNAYRGPEARKIAQRLRALSAGADTSAPSSALKGRMLGAVPLFERVLLAAPRAHRIDRLIGQSGLEWSVAILLMLSALAAVLGAAALGMVAPALPLGFKLLGGVAAGAMPLCFVLWKRQNRLLRIERQLPDALDLIARALRAGHSFQSGLKMVGDELAGPLAREIGLTHDEVNFGVTLQQALTNLGERIPLTDLRYFVVAVVIQRETGGNLTEVLGNLSSLIRERLKLHGKIRVLTAEGRISAWILGLLPFGLVGLMRLGNPEFISVLWTDPAGIRVTQATMALMAVGAIWLWRLTRIRV